jgi:hypothetical protein
MFGSARLRVLHSGQINIKKKQPLLLFSETIESGASGLGL